MYTSKEAFCYIRSSDRSLVCSGITPPSGAWRDVGIASDTYSCGVQNATGVVQCWDQAGNILETMGQTSSGSEIPP